MLKNENIVCISSIDWDFIWQGHQEIMSAYAMNGNRVLFIENTGVRRPSLRDIPRIKKRIKNYFKGVKGIRKVMDNLYVYSPVVLPFPYSFFARFINRYLLLSVVSRWIKIMEFADPVLWTFLPTGISLDIIRSIDRKLLIYYCIDNFSVSSDYAKKIQRTEKKLLELADLVFVTSYNLCEYCSRYSNRVEVFPFGVNIEEFEKVRVIDTKKPNDIKTIKSPIVGYIGGIHKWIDFELVKSTVQENPEISFVYVGPIQVDISSVENLPNVYFLGNKDHRELPYYVKCFNAAIIPYLVTDYTKNVYPTKLNEYLAMGKPVVSTDLPEVRRFNEKYGDIVYVGKDYNEFAEKIRIAIEEDTELLAEKRIKIAQENSWQTRIEKMSGIIEEEILRKKTETEGRWKETLIGFYRTARKRAFRIIAVVGMAYFIVFYTNLFWFLANSLKIEQMPRKSDCIVVFAGGVGESGQAGQGYEERVKHAVDLYKEKYADNIIFSSGYMFVFKEPLVMKALAEELGVPAGSIILEDKAKNTYENAKNTDDILRARGWNKILLVSSPYNMRRASLVYKKIAEEKDVCYNPIPRSAFYSHESKKVFSQKINVRQIKGIIHEYLGIVYYWFKGWV